MTNLQAKKLTTLLEAHYNLFHADLIHKALTDDYITLSSFDNGIKEILRAERRDEDEFVPDGWVKIYISLKVDSIERPKRIR